MNWSKMTFDLVTTVPFTTVVGAVAGLLSMRVARAVAS